MSEMPTRLTRVLVVDDNRDAATSLSYLLTTSGFEVKTFFDGRSALEAAKRFKPDACVLDIQMPGMNGYELARQLRDCEPENPPICATVTAFGDDAHLDRAVEAGFDLHFLKPADPYEVAEQLRDCLQKRSGGIEATIAGGTANQTGNPSRFRKLLSWVVKRSRQFPAFWA